MIACENTLKGKSFKKQYYSTIISEFIANKDKTKKAK